MTNFHGVFKKTLNFIIHYIICTLLICQPQTTNTETKIDILLPMQCRHSVYKITIFVGKLLSQIQKKQKISNGSFEQIKFVGQSISL